MRFANTLYSRAIDYCDAVVSEYMYANGWNSLKTVQGFFESTTDEELVESLLANWHDLLPVMDEHGITIGHMLEAMARLRHNVEQETNLEI